MIEVVSHDPRWPMLFRQIGRRLRGALGETALRIDHIGSTAVAGLAAKPVIDIQISVARLEPVDVYAAPIQELGFRFRPDNPDRTKRFFQAAAEMPRCHLHVRRAGSWSEQFMLLFRDYLRDQDEDAARYGALKQTLYRPDRDVQEYTALKGPLIWEIMAKAAEWSQVVGWEPGPSDA